MTTFAEAIRQIANLQKLPQGWDYGRDGPASIRACIQAITALTQLSRLNADDYEIVPGVDGSVTIIAFRGSDSAEIEALPCGKFNFLHEDAQGGGELKPSVSLAEIIKELEGHGWQSPRLFVSCTQGATLERSNATQAHHFGTQPTAGFPSLAPIALRQVGSKSVLIFGHSTANPRPESRQSSGGYQRFPSQAAYA